MERLAEQIVDWHNRHPLARRIAVGDVHTVGVVALPFVRASADAGAPVEPVLTDVVSAFDELHGSPPLSRWAVWRQRLQQLPARLQRRPRTQWRAFSERFVPGLSPNQIERFALAHGFTEAPATPESQPWRVIVIDESLASSHGGWPFELYLMTAGVDVGSARTRVLAGRGIPSEIIGRRLWDPIRLGAAGGVLALLIAVAAWKLWPERAPEPVAAPPAEAASAPAPAVALPVPAASAPASSASEAADEAASQPDIRPRLVERSDGLKRPPLLRSDKAAEVPADPPSAAASKAEPAADPRLARLAQSPDRIVVALVGPPGSKEAAEALLAKMKAGLAGVHSNPDALQADVIETPEGWRATVWPFPSREQAQLINATLVARGLKTKAVNF